MSAIAYDSKKIIPCPLITIEKTYNRAGDDTKTGSAFTITLRNSICVKTGSPTDSGTFITDPTQNTESATYTINEALKIALKKKEALEGLFSQDGLLFEIQPYDNSQPTTFRPIVRSVIFEEGLWVDSIPYVITLETDRLNGPLYPSGADSISPQIANAEESWNLEFNQEANNPALTNTYRLTHNVNAQGKLVFDGDGIRMVPWEAAREFVLARAGIDYTFVTASGSHDIPNFYRGYDHVRSINTDELGGSVALSESWIISSGDALEDFTVELRETLQEANSIVAINGQVRGLETRGTAPSGSDAYSTVSKTRYQAASGYFYGTVKPALFTRAQLYSQGLPLNSIHVARIEGVNPIAGVINYNYEYDTRPTNCISGAKFETVSIQDTFPQQVVAIHNVLCRDAGSIIQNVQTQTHYGRNVTAEVIMAPSSGCNTNAIISGTRPIWNDLIELIKPPVATYYKINHEESWQPKEGRGGLNIQWIWPIQ